MQTRPSRSALPDFMLTSDFIVSSTAGFSFWTSNQAGSTAAPGACAAHPAQAKIAAAPKRRMKRESVLMVKSPEMEETSCPLLLRSRLACALPASFRPGNGEVGFLAGLGLHADISHEMERALDQDAHVHFQREPGAGAAHPVRQPGRVARRLLRFRALGFHAFQVGREIGAQVLQLVGAQAVLRVQLRLRLAVDRARDFELPAAGLEPDLRAPGIPCGQGGNERNDDSRRCRNHWRLPSAYMPPPISIRLPPCAGGATEIPRMPFFSIERAMNPEALASSIKSRR